MRDRGRTWLAAAAILAVAAALCGLRQVDGAFVRTHHALDLDHPGNWASDPTAVAPGSLGRLLWSGERPLEARFGPVATGDILKLKVRAERPGVRVRLLLDGWEVVTGPAPTDWRPVELVLTRPGQLLRFEQPDRPSAPVHISRISATNVRGFVEGPLTLYLRSAQGAPTAPRPRASGVLLALVMPALALLVVGWRRLVGERDPRAALRAAVLEQAPGIALLVGGELLGLVSDLRLVYPPRTFLLLLAVPTIAIEAVRSRAALRSWLAAVPPWLGAAARALDGRLQTLAGRLGLERVTAAAAESGGGLAGRDLRRAFLVHLGVVAALGLLFAGLVIQDFGGPMLGNGDLSLWSHQGYYLSRNLSLAPLPHLDLVNDQLWYPYGGSNVFQPWVLEMHLFTASCDRLFGPGPWLQLYYLLTLVVAALGAFALLAPDHGAFRAGLVAVAATFCNYYAIAKFAGHLGLSCSGWMTLNLLADWVLVRRFVRGRPWSARLLALRALLLVLVLGEDLSYVAGIALTSFSVCALVVGLLWCVRNRCRPRRLVQDLRAGVGQLRGSLGRHPVQVAALAAAALLVGWLWVPLVLEISRATRAFDLSLMPKGGAWVNPLRLLIPVLPDCNPVTHFYLFKDAPEAWFAASPGLFFLLAGLLGILWGWRRVLCWLPFLLLLVLLLSFHPQHFALLRLLPWFSLARMCGRFSLAYPVALSILFLNVPATAFGRGWGRPLLLLGCALLAVEATTAYRVALIRPRAFYRPDAAFARLMGTIREAPGEAVLEWPFCIAGGNGVGTGELGPYYSRQSGISALQQFHHKKVMGKYFGRLHPDQIRPYLRAGWPRMLFPDVRDAHRAKRQRRDFLPREWEFLERFFVLNDFCGVLLFPDLLPKATVAGFHQRFGEPAAVAAATPFGRLEFIPKRPGWRGLVDREAGKRLALPDVPPPRPVARLNLGDPAAAEYLRSGWGAYQKRWRSSEGPVAEIAFSLERVETLLLTMDATTFQRQRVRVLLNGVKVDELLHDGGAFTFFTVILPAELLRPSNVLRFELPDAHSPKSVGVSQDARVLGITLEWLELSTPG